MAAEEDEVQPPPPAVDGHDKIESESDNDNDNNSGDGDGEAVEMLVTGRAKRTTAGNRMGSMLGQIAADDDLELLFAEDEEAGPDEEFDEDMEDAAASDNDLGESSDDEDQGPAAAGAEDLDGEKEIERQAKEERKRKRKAQRAFTKPSKRAKHVPFAGSTMQQQSSSSSTVPASKAKKKAERLSWMPTGSNLVRTSKRETTTLQSEALRTRIVAREKERKEQVKRLEEKARRREANKPRKLTQEDRFKEAAEVERENSKSLNRWEAIERERQEEQKARLAALQNRQLQGPVVSYWSGPARWIGEKLTAVGSEKVKRAQERHALKGSEPSDHEGETDKEAGTEKKTDRRPEGGADAAEKNDKTEHAEDGPSSTDQPPVDLSSRDITLRPKSAGSMTASIQVTAPPTIHSTSPQPPDRAVSNSKEPSAAPSASPRPSPQPSIQTAKPSEAPSASSRAPSPSQEPDAPSVSPQPPGPPKSTEKVSEATPETPSQPKDQPSKEQDPPQGNEPKQIVFSLAPPPQPPHSAYSPSPAPSDRSSAQGSSSQDVSRQKTPQQQQQQPSSQQQQQQPQIPAGPPPPPPKPVVATRNLVSVANVDVSNPSSSTAIPRELQGSLLVASAKPVKRTRAPKQPATPTCTVTGLPVKYRDSRSGLGYANPYAYRQLRNVRDGKLAWNEVTGTYVGPAPRVAEGVPEEFVKAMNAGKA